MGVEKRGSYLLVHAGDDPEHFKIGVHYDPRRPPALHEFTEGMEAEVNRLMQILFLLHPPPPRQNDLPPRPPQQSCHISGMTTDTKIEHERNNQEREEISLVQAVGEEGKMKPEQKSLESSLAGTGLEGPGQLHLTDREMQQIALESCTHVDRSSELG